MPIPPGLKRQLRYAKYYLFGYSTTNPSAPVWDSEHRRGDWRRLDDLSELAHYSVIVGYCRHFRARAILDIGCGHGGLARMLDGIGCEAYLGIDFSEAAVAAARAAAANPAHRFELADAGRFVPPRSFDTLVFNESLYYFSEPDALIERYLGFLEPGGRVIVSAFVSGQERALLRLIRRVLPIRDRTEVENGQGQRWVIAVLAKASA
jgi:SAM-dependent methyltransferase